MGLGDQDRNDRPKRSVDGVLDCQAAADEIKEVVEENRIYSEARICLTERRSNANCFGS